MAETQYAQLLTDEEVTQLKGRMTTEISTGVPVIAAAQPISKAADGEPIVTAQMVDGQQVVMVAAGEQAAATINGQQVVMMAVAPGQQPPTTMNGQAVVMLVAAPAVGGQQVPVATASPRQQPAEEQRTPRANLRPGPYKKGMLMKKAVDGVGWPSHRTFVLWGDKITWHDGDKPRGVLTLEPITHVKYSPSSLLLSIQTGDRELQLYPRDKKEEGAEEEMRAWFAAVEEVVSTIKARYAEWRAQNPEPVHYYDGRGGYYRRYSDDLDGADAALCVGTGLLTGCCVGALLF